MHLMLRLCLLLACALPVSVLAANPQLLAYEQGIEDPESESAALRLSDLSIDVDVLGALADFTLTARFANSSDETLEGRFSFALPDGAVVTGYALDIDGTLVEGVLIDERKAERVFNARVRRGVDPGVAEVSRANEFSTRVYPIFARGERVIRLKFSAPVHGARGLWFPLETEEAVGQFRVTLSSAAVVKLPEVTLPPGLALAWQDQGNAQRASAALYGKPLSGELRIAPLRPRVPALLSIHANGARTVHIVDHASRLEKGRDSGKRVRVYWDRSLSRRDDDLAAERALLSRHLANSRPTSIDLVLFNSSGATVRRLTAGEVDAALAAVIYRGGTSFAVLDDLRAPAADQCLVFTDGVATVDARPDFEPGCEVFALSSARDADAGFLSRIAGGSAAVLRVGVQKDDEVLARLRGAGPRVIRVHTEQGRNLEFTSLDGGENGWSVIAQVPSTDPVIVQIAGVRGQIMERRYAPWPARRASFDAAGALWAVDHVMELAARDDAHAEFVEQSRKYSVATPGMSFLVLETMQDYVEADIRPPANLREEQLAEYRELLAAHEERRKEARDERLEEVLGQWNEVVDWWNTRFDPRARKPAAGPSALRAGAVNPPAPVASMPDTRRRVDTIHAQELAEFDGALDSVVVTGQRASLMSSMNVMKSAAAMVAEIDVDMEEWDLDRPYLKALEGARPADVDRVIAAQEREFGALPMFYFDVAEWLRRHERAGDAEEMLLSALELPMSGAQTGWMVAERLQRYGSFDRAIGLLERVAQRVDFLPQPRRSLALALAKRAALPHASSAREDLERAVKLLDEVIMTPWEGAFDGIEMVSLMEVNALLPKLRALGVRRIPLDERLRALLDVDLRVVIEWNTEATDMDLWVDEPNGERAIYSHPRTAIGGRLSNDMTEGYGPEEYLLRHAAKGEYQIRINVYSADEINPNGSTVVTARLFRNYGRPNQSEEAMELELEPGDEGEKLVGKFTVR